MLDITTADSVELLDNVQKIEKHSLALLKIIEAGSTSGNERMPTTMMTKKNECKE